LANFEDRAQYSNTPAEPFAVFLEHFYRLLPTTLLVILHKKLIYTDTSQLNNVE
jgi:hypothetical protein